MEKTTEIGELLISEKQISERVKQLGEQIASDYAGKDILLIGVLRGAFIFLADLLRHIHENSAVDFMAVSSYGSGAKSSGVVRILKDLDVDIKGKDVLLVEDIIDTGLTLQYLIRNLKSREPNSLQVCTLLYKELNQKLPVEIRYIGFKIAPKFVIGYGLDYNEKFRNLKSIFAVNEEPS
jgi:hypoxanthine phosphoribosyltransferase